MELQQLQLNLIYEMLAWHALNIRDHSTDSVNTPRLVVCPIGWSGLFVSASWASGPSERCFLVQADDSPRSTSNLLKLAASNASHHKTLPANDPTHTDQTLCTFQKVNYLEEIGKTGQTPKFPIVKNQRLTKDQKVTLPEAQHLVSNTNVSCLLDHYFTF